MANRHGTGRNRKLTLLPMLIGLLMFQTATAQAALMVVDSVYENSFGTVTVWTKAFFDTSPVGGTGTERVLVEELNLRFSNRSFSQSAILVLAGPPFPEKAIVAQFIDGIFDDFFSISQGGNSSVKVTPPSNFLGENIILGRSVLTDIPCCSGFTKYGLVSHSDPTQVGGPSPVPLPAALPLFVMGLAGLGVAGWRRQRRTA